MKLIFFVFITLAINTLFALFHYEVFANNRKDSQGGVHKSVIQEVLQTSSYTYLRVKENEAEIWLAVPKMVVSVGETYYHADGMEMKDFNGKEVNRTFKSIFFLSGLSKSPDLNKGTSIENSHKSKPTTEKITIKIDPAPDRITIADLFEKKQTYSGKIVRIKGQVAKFSEKIMSKNWIHFQDGSEFSGKFDLVITTDIIVKTGDIITVEGKVSLDKDFGNGYFYDVLLEDTKLISK